jgi:hypothetical protein
MRTIKNISVGLTNALGEPYRFASKDDAGNRLLDDAGQMIPVDGDTCDLLQSMLVAYVDIKWAFWNGDSKAFARVMKAVNACRATEDDFIILDEGDYEWMVGDGQGKVGILDRKMPPASRAAIGIDEDNPLSHPTVGMLIWNANESHLRDYLKAE